MSYDFKCDSSKRQNFDYWSLSIYLIAFRCSCDMWFIIIKYANAIGSYR